MNALTWFLLGLLVGMVAGPLSLLAILNAIVGRADRRAARKYEQK